MSLGAGTDPAPKTVSPQSPPPIVRIDDLSFSPRVDSSLPGVSTDGSVELPESGTSRRVTHLLSPRWTKVFHDQQRTGPGWEFPRIIEIKHPNLAFTPTEEQVFATQEMQALFRRCQMPVCFTTRAEANGETRGLGFEHSRGQHCVHALEIAEEIARRNGLGATDRSLIRLATGIHDIGHPALSHSTEIVLQRLHGTFDIVELFGGPAMLERILGLAYPGQPISADHLLFDHDLHGALRVLTGEVGELIDEEGARHRNNPFTREDVVRLLFDDHGLGRVRDEADRIAYLRLDHQSTHFPHDRILEVNDSTQQLINCLYIERPSDNRGSYRVWLRDDWIQRRPYGSPRSVASAMGVFEEVMKKRFSLFAEYSLCPARLVMDEALQLLVARALEEKRVSVHEILRMSDRSLIERFHPRDQRLFGFGPQVERRPDCSVRKFDDYFASERWVTARSFNDPNDIRSSTLRIHLQEAIQEATGLQYGEFFIAATHEHSKDVKANLMGAKGNRTLDHHCRFSAREEDQLLLVAVDRDVPALTQARVWDVFDRTLKDVLRSPREINRDSPFSRHIDMRRFMNRGLVGNGGSY